jgi:hypothetical protein
MAKDEVEFVEEIPPPRRGNLWVVRLKPLVENPGRPGLIQTCDSAQQAYDAVKNLNARNVIIPRPDHHWVFTARDNVVYGIYKGPGKKVTSRGSVRRTK